MPEDRTGFLLLKNHPLKGTICSGPRAGRRKPKAISAKSRAASPSTTLLAPAHLSAPGKHEHSTLAFAAKLQRQQWKRKKNALTGSRQPFPWALQFLLSQSCHLPCNKLIFTGHSASRIQSGLPGSWGSQHFNINCLHSNVMEGDCSCHYFKWLEATQSPISLAAFINRSYT